MQFRNWLLDVEIRISAERSDSDYFGVAKWFALIWGDVINK